MEKYLKKCLDSIVAQTYETLEIILVNDGSKDSSLEICEQYALKDKRIIVVNKENGGQGSARNAGLDIAVGDWVGFVDSDDWIVADMYETLLRYCKENNADIAVCEAFTTEPNRGGECVRVLDYDAFYPELIYDHISSHPCNKLFRRSLFENNTHGRIRYPLRNSVDDMMIMPELFGDAKRIVMTDKTLYCYFNTREDSVSNSKRTTHLNSYERSLAFQKRYEITMEKGYDVDEVFGKAISFGIGAYGRMGLYKGLYLSEKGAFRKYIREHRPQIKSNRHLSFSRKAACILIDRVPKVYECMFCMLRNLLD